MRLRLRLVAAVGLPMAVIASCGTFEPAPADPDDAGPEGAGPEGTADADPDDDVVEVVDAGRCNACRSGACDEDGGCHPQVFVTSMKYRGDFDSDGGVTGIARADEICQSLGGSPRFRAWLSMAAVDALNRFTGNGGATRPLLRVDRVRAADSIDRLIRDKGLARPIVVTETGSSVLPTDNVWTGTSGQSVAVDQEHCMRWTARNALTGVPQVSAVGRVGRAGATDSDWTSVGSAACNSLERLYCIEVVP